MPGMGHSGAARAAMLNFTQTGAFLDFKPQTSNLILGSHVSSVAGVGACA